MVRSISSSVSARGVSGLIGDLIADGATDVGVIAVAAAVQDLQHDAAARVVNRPRDHCVPGGIRGGGHQDGLGDERAFVVR